MTGKGELFGLEEKEILAASKKPDRVAARSIVCYWAVIEIGMAGSAVGTLLGMTQSAVSRAVARGERSARKRQLILHKPRKS